MREKGVKTRENSHNVALKLVTGQFQRLLWRKLDIAWLLVGRFWQSWSWFKAVNMLPLINGYPGTRRVLVSGYPGSKMCIHNSSIACSQTHILQARDMHYMISISLYKQNWCVLLVVQTIAGDSVLFVTWGYSIKYVRAERSPGPAHIFFSCTKNWHPIFSFPLQYVNSPCQSCPHVVGFSHKEGKRIAAYVSQTVSDTHYCINCMWSNYWCSWYAGVHYLK